MLAAVAGCAAPLPEVRPLAEEQPALPQSRALDSRFLPGEELTYDAFFCGLKAGEAVMRVEGRGEGGLDIHLTAATSGPAALAFPIHEAAVVQAHAATLRPVRARVQANLGDDRRRISLHFDDATHSVVGRFHKGDTPTVRLLRAAEAWDPASLLLLVRSLDLTPPFQADYELILGTRLVLLALRATDRQDVETPAGSYPGAQHLVGSVYPLDETGQAGGEPLHQFEAWIARSGSRPVVRLTKLTRLGRITFELSGVGGTE